MSEIIKDGDKFFVQREIKASTLKARLTSTKKDLENAEKQVKLWSEKIQGFKADIKELEKILGEGV